MARTMSLDHHQSILTQQKNHFEGIIQKLKDELFDVQNELELAKNTIRTIKDNAAEPMQPVSKYDLHYTNVSNKRRKSTVLLSDLVDPNQRIEDELSDSDDETDIIQRSRQGTASSPQTAMLGRAHNRRATSLIIEDLLGPIDEQSNDGDGESTSSSSIGAMEAIALEQQLVDIQYKGIEDVGRLKHIIETLKKELGRSRVNVLEQQTNSQRLKEETIDLEAELCSERNERLKLKNIIETSPDTTSPGNHQHANIIFQRNVQVVVRLCIEMDKMRHIIKQQQCQIDALM